MFLQYNCFYALNNTYLLSQIFKENKYFCLDGVQSDDRSTEQMDGSNDRKFKVHGTSADKNMSVTGKETT